MPPLVPKLPKLPRRPHEYRDLKLLIRTEIKDAAKRNRALLELECFAQERDSWIFAVMASFHDFLARGEPPPDLGHGWKGFHQWAGYRSRRKIRRPSPRSGVTSEADALVTILLCAGKQAEAIERDGERSGNRHYAESRRETARRIEDAIAFLTKDVQIENPDPETAG